MKAWSLVRPQYQTESLRRATLHMNNTVFLGNKDFHIDTITQCLTDDCDECTGSYSNSLLRHRLYCRCPCHILKKSHLVNEQNGK